MLGYAIWAGGGPFLLVDAVQVQPEQRPLFKVAVLEPEFVQRARVGDKDPTLRDLELAPSRAARQRVRPSVRLSQSAEFSFLFGGGVTETYMKQRLK